MRIVALCVFLGACAPGTIVQDRPTTVSVPVTVPCVAAERPTVVAPLNELYSADEWFGKSTKQKTSLASAQGLRRKSYGEALNASTGECQ